MSLETNDWLYNNVLAGFVKDRGNPWWYTGEIEGVPSPLYDFAVPTEDVLKLFGWDILVGQAMGILPDGRQAPIPNTKTLHRSDTGAVIGKPSQSYPIHSYQEWLVDNLGLILDDPDLKISSAGLLRGGAVAWVSVQMNTEAAMSKHGVRYMPFMTWATSTDSSISTTGQRNNTVIVCDNTLTASFKETDREDKIIVPHRPNAKLDVTKARDVLQILSDTQDEFDKEIEALCSIKMTDRVWDGFVEKMIPLGKGKIALSRSQNVRDRWHDMRDNDPRCAPWGKSLFGAVQVANTFKLHHSIAKKKKGEEEPDRFTKNMDMILGGDMDDFDREVVELLTALSGKTI